MQITALAIASALVGYAPAPAPAPAAPRTHPLSAGSAQALIVASPNGSLVPESVLDAAMTHARLVAVGEKHDSAPHHQVQAELLAHLADLSPRTGVGFEMISYEDQAVLDAFSNGSMSEADFAAFWKKAWGFDYSLYKPVFDEARRRRLPLYALNAPSELVRAVAKKGLAGLTPAERSRLPERIEESADARYREFVLEAVSSHKLSALLDTDPAVIERRIQAMAVWNETMGEQAARRVAEGRTLFLVAGQGHLLYGAGVPESARRRGVGTTVVVLPYPFEPEAGLGVPEMLARLRDPAQGELQQADYFRLIP